jgi:ribosomal protein S18 acetylase RimI-like enzyme
VATVAVEHDTPPQVRDLPWLTRPPQRFLMVHRLAVLPPHRRRGYATYLMRFIEDLAAWDGCASVRLGVYSDNPAAVGLYDRLGYGRIGEVVMPFREKPFICMEKLVAPAWRKS